MSVLINPYILGSPPFIFTPDALAGLEMWLKADSITGLSDGDPVPTWEDLSSAGNDVTQGTSGFRPTYQTAEANGKAIVRFDGIDDHLIGADFSSLTEAHIFIVVKIAADPPASNAETGLWHLGNSGGFPDTHYPYTDNSIYESFGSNSRHSVGNPGPALDTYRIYSIHSATNDWEAKIDGVSIYSTATNTVSFHTTSIIGKSVGSYYLNGDVAEIVLYSNKLLGIDETAVIEYLKTEYAL